MLFSIHYASLANPSQPVGPADYMNGTCCTSGCYNPITTVMEALYGFKDDGGAWNAAYLDHEIRHYCGGHASDDEIPCSKDDRKHNRSCRKKCSKPRIIGGLATHSTADSSLVPFYQNFNYEDMTPGTSKNPFYESRTVFGWHRCDPFWGRVAMDERKSAGKPPPAGTYSWNVNRSSVIKKS